jgi:hypothetical protein
MWQISAKHAELRRLSFPTPPFQTSLSVIQMWLRGFFGRAGLPCASCDYSKSESLSDALNIHIVGPRQSSVLMAKVNAFLGSN